MKRWMFFVTAIAALAPAAGAQQYQRRATIVGGGDRDHGKCTIEVVVDGAADIEIRGDQGTVRNISGQPAQWRRFECTGPMPANAANFRFAGVDGRGRQQLLRDPRNGGAAVIRIEDPQGGAEGYTFDLTWGGNFNYGNPPTAQRPPFNERAPGQFRRFTTEQAVNVCQDSVRQQAVTRFRGRGIEFRGTRIDDQPGRNDWVVGMVDVLRGPNAPEEHLRFSCSVNFDNGQVRSVELSPMAEGYRQESSDRAATNVALDACRQAVSTRMQRDNYGQVEFQSIRVDDKPGRDDWVIGTVRADRGRGPDAFNFSCSVDLRNGEVRSVDVTRR
jgi:hypothetical protein